MIQKDKPPDDPTTGLNNPYCTLGNGSFFIDAPYVRTKNQTLTKGKTYIIIWAIISTALQLTAFKLIDLWFRDGYITMNILDFETDIMYTIEQCLENCKGSYNWTIVDMNYLQDIIDTEIIRMYCAKG